MVPTRPRLFKFNKGMEKKNKEAYFLELMPSLSFLNASTSSNYTLNFVHFIHSEITLPSNNSVDDSDKLEYTVL